ncbi:phage tail fiber protein [Enterobacter hormaechei subsp. xiangfangensis]|uniref:phage tail fiber domain-containing protein n=1 Tax=Enterobacter hormaechei TaxID=158836 RepID=UPI003DA30971
MSVPNQTPYIIYNANGLTTLFPFEFYIINAGDIQVTINGTVITSGYTVSGVGNIGGGDVIFITPPASGSVVMLERVVPMYRLTDYQDNGDLLADTVNKDFDRLWMAIQRYGIHLGLALRRPLFGGPFDAEGYRIEKLADPVNAQDAVTKKYLESVSLARVLRVPEASVGLVPSLDLRRNKLLAFNNSGDPIPVLPESGSASDVMIELAKPTGSSHIGYQYPADGSVPRTVEDKLGDFVSVLDFGAKGDGVTDDSIAFRDAIATGKTVYVPDTSGNNLGCVYKVSGIDVTTIKLVGESQRVEIQPVSTATRILNLKGTSPASPARGCFIRNITFSSPATSEGLFHDAVLLENTNQCDVSNVTLYLVQLTVLGHNYLRLDKINGIGARLSVSRHSGDSIDNAVGLLLKDSFLAYNSEVDIRNSTDTRIVDTYIANSKSDGRTGLNHDYDAEFLPGGSVFFGGVLMITNVICECVCVIKYTALSKFTGFWAGAFYGNGLTLLNSYGLLATNCTFHYSTGAGVYARNLTDCTFVSSSFTNSEGGGFDLDESVRTTFVACTFSKFELYE